MPERLANQLKERRTELGLTQAELAEKVGVTRKTVNTVENGVFTPSATLAVAEISTATGRPIRYVQVSPQDFAAGMRQGGVPEDLVALLDELFSVVLDGRNCQVMHGVDEALGRPARDFSIYTRATAASGMWSVPSVASRR